MPLIDQSILDQIQPVVLVGGRSLRFGRDKLLESVDGSPMVAAPIEALRSVFGNRVAIVGDCDARILELADAVIDDPYPGLGPVGGICAGLEGAGRDVLVCAGDLVSMDPSAIRQIVSASIAHPDALAYLAFDGRRHPTAGLYRVECVPFFVRAIAEGKLKLGMVLDEGRVQMVEVESSALRNINRPEELGG